MVNSTENVTQLIPQTSTPMVVHNGKVDEKTMVPQINK